MATNTIRITIFSVVALAASSAQAQSRATLDLTWVDSIVRAQSTAQSLPGVGVTVVKNGSPILVRGYGITDIRTRTAVTAATPFNIASLTKSFTSLLATQLVREGKLTLDAPARRYLAWLPAQYATITVRQLLTHTSGIVRDVRQSNEDDPDAVEFRARVVRSEASAKPGERFEYSNTTGFTVLGWIIESVEGAPLDSVYRRRIFQPLGMTQAAYREPLTRDSVRARPHNVVSGKAQTVPYITGGFASGGISLSIADMAKFAVALQRDQLVSSAWRDSMWTPGRLSDKSPAATMMFGDSAGYGFGWFVAKHKGRRVLTHGGAINGYSSMLLHFPKENLSIAVIANSKAPVEPIARAIADFCLETERCTVSRATSKTFEEIDAVGAAFSRAYVSGDTAAIRAIYTENAMLLPPSGRAFVGAGSSARLFNTRANAGRYPVAHATYSEWRAIDGNTVVDTGTWYDEWFVGTATTQRETGRYVITWVKTASGWRMLGDAWVGS